MVQIATNLAKKEASTILRNTWFVNSDLKKITPTLTIASNINDLINNISNPNATPANISAAVSGFTVQLQIAVSLLKSTAARSLTWIDLLPVQYIQTYMQDPKSRYYSDPIRG